MSDNIPFEIMQVEILKRLPVKSLVQFRSVSKAWKSLIDGSDFIKHYGHVHYLLVRYTDPVDYDIKHVSIVDDHTFPQQKVSLTVPPLINMLKYSSIIGSSHGLLCLFSGYEEGLGGDMAVLWNPSIRKAVVVGFPSMRYRYGIYRTFIGFGVCGNTTDPKIVKITYISKGKDIESISCIPWQVEVFTLSTGGWRSLHSNLPRKSIQFYRLRVGLAVDGVLYWLATDRISTMNGEFGSVHNLIISFDITTEEFSEVSLPDTLARHQREYELSMSKLRESLVVLERVGDANDPIFGVWLMGDGVPKSFTKIFTICTPDATILCVLEFRKNGEPLIEIVEDHCDSLEDDSSLVVYDPYSKHLSNLGINGICSSSVYYMETLLLLDQPDFVASNGI